MVAIMLPLMEGKCRLPALVPLTVMLMEECALEAQAPATEIRDGTDSYPGTENV